MKTLLALLLLITTNAFAAPYNQSVKLPDEKLLLKPSKDFNAIIVLVEDNDKFKETWLNKDINVSINTTNRVKQSESLHAWVILSNCAVKNDACNVSFKGEIVQPNKSKIDIPISDLIVRKFPQGTLGVGDNIVEVQMDKKDTLGLYKLKLELTDHNSKKVLPLYKEFTLVK